MPILRLSYAFRLLHVGCMCLLPLAKYPVMHFAGPVDYVVIQKARVWSRKSSRREGMVDLLAVYSRLQFCQRDPHKS